MEHPNSRTGFSRRGFLQFVGASTALGLSGAAFVRARLPAAHFPAADAYRWLDPQTLLVLQRLAEIWLPRGDGEFVAYSSLPVWPQFDVWLGRLSTPLRESFLLGLKGFDYAAFVYGWHGEPFSALAPEPARRYIDRWFAGSSDQKALVGAMRQILHLSYWRFPQTWPATGYQGPLFLRTSIPALGTAPLPP